MATTTIPPSLVDTLSVAKIPTLPTSKIDPYPGTGLAPTPTATADTVGEWKVVTAAAGAELNAPAGGTWAYFAWYNDAAHAFFGPYAGVKAGGTQLIPASGILEPKALVWRVS
jgi:hypothetical protein